MANSNHIRSGAFRTAHLENQMVLLDWMHGMLGYESTKALLHDMKGVSGDFGSEGFSYIYRKLQSREVVKIPSADLSRYDANIHEYVTRINDGREETITLQYFQYLAILYTEIFLDYYFNHRYKLMTMLNERIEKINADVQTNEYGCEPFAEADLKKLAFWMATGSGKTLIMHINYMQFLKYNNEPLDNILLITPNEGLSQQHLDDLKSSNIPASNLIHNGTSSLESGRDNEIKVIEITKIVAKKTGEGESIAVDSLEGNKLVLVDEGHKGSGGDVWRNVRDVLGQEGFTFEYSATFGQALAAAGNYNLVNEYGKNILFDYSYRHFYADGYGKDFHIINLQDESSEDQTNTLLLANLLSFYEQHRIYAEHAEEVRTYNLEKPLWLFVGHKVNATYTENKQPRSDVLTIVRFLHRILSDKSWTESSINRLLNGKSDLKDDNGCDIFQDKFKYLRENGVEAVDAYVDILLKVFHTTSSSGLHIRNIRDGDGELGLKAGGSDDYFGLIYIGDKSKFKKLVEVNCPNIVIEHDVIFTGSLFSNIDNADTTVEILVGAKRFLEGWNSWRVSAMGLLNIGKDEGSQIIQLFGRGVRLRGLLHSLKRSSALDDKHPKYIRYLETLNIFSLRAKYMEQFRKHLEVEGIPIHETVHIPLPIRINQEFLRKGLIVPCVNQNTNFKEEKIMLNLDSSIRVVVNTSPRIIKIASGTDGITETTIALSDGQQIPADSLRLVDMAKIYVELLDNKEGYGRHNMVIGPDMPEKILKEAKYSIIAGNHVLRPRVFQDVHLLQKAATSVVVTYAKRFYNKRQEEWEQSNMSYQTLNEEDPNFQDYTISIPDNEDELVRNVREIARECDRIYRKSLDVLPNVHFDGHLYLPLLVAGDERISTKPLGLNQGEHRFVEDLREYCMDEQNDALVDKELFLLRNLSRKGIGFFQNSNFYPDFILWIRSGNAQRIIFVEPHGMLHDGLPDHNDKVQLHKTLHDLSKRLQHKSEMKKIVLDSYIVSQTDHDKLIQFYGEQWDIQRCADSHILFPKRSAEYDYISQIIQ